MGRAPISCNNGLFLQYRQFQVSIVSADIINKCCKTSRKKIAVVRSEGRRLPLSPRPWIRHWRDVIVSPCLLVCSMLVSKRMHAVFTLILHSDRGMIRVFEPPAVHFQNSNENPAIYRGRKIHGSRIDFRPKSPLLSEITWLLWNMDH